MARGGVTFTEVDSAAQFLQGQGKNPTVDAIRERLGTGSRTTLAEHLKRWKSLQADGEGKLPQPLLSLVSGLWDSLQSLSEKRIEENRYAAVEEITALKSQLQIALQSEATLKQDYHQSQEKLDTGKRNFVALNQEHQIILKAHDKLQTSHQSTLQQLDNSKEENKRLHQLTQQIQANLEHYQRSIEQKQLQQKLEQEKQYAITAHEISQLKTALEEANLRYHQTEKTYSSKEVALKQLQENYDEVTASHQKLTEKFEAINHINTQLRTENNMHQKQIDKITAESLEIKALMQSQQEQIAVTEHQLKHAQISLQQAENKIEQLRNEKLFLVQEKSSFEGALKQLQTGFRV